MSFLFNFSKTSKSFLKRNITTIRHFRNSICDRSLKLLVLTYHRIAPRVKFDIFSTFVSPEKFNKQINTLAKKYQIISLSEAIQQSSDSSRSRERIKVVLTFDDGYKDNYDIAYHILKNKGLPATFFIATNYMDSGLPLWDYEVSKIIYNSKNIRKVKIGKLEIIHNFTQSRMGFISLVINRMKYLSLADREVTLKFLREQDSGKGIPDMRDSCMTWSEIIEMSKQNMEIGSHSKTHSSLANMPLSEAIEEIRESKRDIEKRTGKDCLHFAFPFGSQKDYNQNLIDCVINSGFQTCLINRHGYNDLNKQQFCLKRIIVKEDTDLHFLLG